MIRNDNATRVARRKQRAGIARLDKLFLFDRGRGARTIQTGRGPAKSAPWRARRRRNALAVEALFLFLTSRSS